MVKTFFIFFALTCLREMSLSVVLLLYVNTTVFVQKNELHVASS
jgi:hypothetical protein